MSQENNKLTHSDLVQAAYRWVLKYGSCGCAFKELTAYSEIADVIGFGSGEHSVLIEVKVSRSDFICDKKKSFRINPDLGMGKRRFYCCPEYMIRESELPFGWGLIYVNEHNKPTCVYNPNNQFMQIAPSIERDKRFTGFIKNEKAERAIMYSALRRLQLNGSTKTIYNFQPTPQ